MGKRKKPQADGKEYKKTKFSTPNPSSVVNNDESPSSVTSSVIYDRDEDRLPISHMLLMKKMNIGGETKVAENKVVGTECNNSSQIVANDDIIKDLVPKNYNKMIDEIFCTLPNLQEEHTEVEAMTLSYFVSPEVKNLIKSNNLNLEDILTEKKQSNSSYLNYDVLFQPFVKLVAHNIHSSNMLNDLTDRESVIKKVNMVAELLLTPLVLTLRLSKLFGPKRESYAKFYHTESLHSTMKESIEIMPAKSGVSHTDVPRTMTKKSIKDNTREVCTFNYMISVLLTIILYH